MRMPMWTLCARKWSTHCITISCSAKLIYTVLPSILRVLILRSFNFARRGKNCYIFKNNQFLRTTVQFAAVR